MEFVDLFQSLERYGLTDALLPFILIFTILFAMFQKTKILGEGKKNFNVMVSFVMAMLVVIPHVTNSYPPGKDIVEILNSALPNVSLLVVAVILGLLLIGLFTGESAWGGSGTITGGLALLSFGMIVYIFGGSAGWWRNLSLEWGSETTSIVVIILIFAIIIWYVTKPEKDDGKGNRLLSDLGKAFGGK